MPTARQSAIASGSRARRPEREAERREHDGRDEHRRREARGAGPDVRDAPADHDVDGPRAAREEDEADARPGDVGQAAAEQADAEQGEARPEEVEAAVGGDHGDGDRTPELDRHGRPERDTLDAEVEGRVHHGKRDAEVAARRHASRVERSGSRRTRMRTTSASAPNAIRPQAMPTGPIRSTRSQRPRRRSNTN